MFSMFPGPMTHSWCARVVPYVAHVGPPCAPQFFVPHAGLFTASTPATSQWTSEQFARTVSAAVVSALTYRDQQVKAERLQADLQQQWSRLLRQTEMMASFLKEFARARGPGGKVMVDNALFHPFSSASHVVASITVKKAGDLLQNAEKLSVSDQGLFVDGLLCAVRKEARVVA